jgi:hypothetical protein
MDWDGLWSFMWFCIGWVAGIATVVAWFCWGLLNEGN